MTTLPKPKPPAARTCVVCEQQKEDGTLDTHMGPCPASSNGKRAHVFYRPGVKP